MNLLLDTHAWLWFVLGAQELSKNARQSIEDPKNAKFISPASYWELAIKISLGKYDLRAPLAKFIRGSIDQQGFRLIPILPAHAEYLSTMPFSLAGAKEHRDPFDRILIAQAAVEGFSLLSNDRKLDTYGIRVVW